MVELFQMEQGQLGPPLTVNVTLVGVASRFALSSTARAIKVAELDDVEAVHLYDPVLFPWLDAKSYRHQWRLQRLLRLRLLNPRLFRLR